MHEISLEKLSYIWPNIKLVLFAFWVGRSLFVFECYLALKASSVKIPETC